MFSFGQLPRRQHEFKSGADVIRTLEVVGNIGPLTFGQDHNSLLLIDANGVRELQRAPKLTLARELVAEIAARLPDYVRAAKNP